MVVMFAGTTVAKNLRPRCELLRIRDQRAGITPGAEVFGRIKTESAPGAEDASASAIGGSAVCLCAIFKEVNFRFVTKIDPTPHLADLSVQMDEQNGFRPGR